MQNTEAVMPYSLNNTLLRKQVHKKFRNDTESMISAISGQISISSNTNYMWISQLQMIQTETWT